MKTLCPKCGAPGSELRICYPAWFKFEDTDDAVDASTLDTVDAEASPRQYCEACSESWETKNFEMFHDPSCPPLDEWVHNNAQVLSKDVSAHIEALIGDHEQSEDLHRCIMTSIRQYLERRT